MPRKYSMDVRNEETAARRRRLIDAAVEVLGEVGAERLTMDAVADRADTATRTLYNHFGSRDDLIEAAYDALIGLYEVAFRLEQLDDATPRAQLHDLVTRLFAEFDEQGEALTTMMDHRKDPRIAERIDGLRQWRRDRIAEILRPVEDELRSPLREAVALAFAMTNHSSWIALVDECGLAPATVRALTLDALDRSLFADP